MSFIPKEENEVKDLILVADDVELNREILDDILNEQYDILFAADGEQAIGYTEEYSNKLAVTLLDLGMPKVDGFGVLKYMNEKSYISKIPVIVITGNNSVDSERTCFDYGITEFIRKPFDTVIVNMRVGNIVKLYKYKNNLEEKVAEQTETLSIQNEQLMKQAARLAEGNQRIIEMLGNVVESRDLESGVHIQRVKYYTKIIANQIMNDYPEYNLNEHDVDVIVSASALHDVGKVAIPDSILLKPGRLTKDEFEVMKTHTVRGCELIDNIKDIWDDKYARLSYEICRYHHERYDGLGYPDRLKGEEIPISAQIVSLADVYDALVHKRVYKDAFNYEEAYNMIMNGECGVISPKILDCFAKNRDKFEALNC